MRDIKFNNLELALADLTGTEKRPRCEYERTRGNRELTEALNNDVPARAVDLTGEEKYSITFLELLTMKPVRQVKSYHALRPTIP